MKNELFDKLEWTGDWWETSVEIPYFSRIGARLREDSDGVTRGPTGSTDLAAIRPNPPILFTIHTGEVRRPPSKGQLEGWRRICERGDQIWQECIARLRPEYERQRPARVRWWKATYGPEGIDDVLPEVSDDAEFASLIVPIHVKIHEPAGKSPLADVGVTFACTWYKDNCGIIIWDGEVAEVGGAWVASRIVPVQERMVHPILGPLRRVQKGGPWIGEVRIDPFLDFACIAGTRAAFARDPINVQKRSELDWNFARGEFHFLIFANSAELTLDSAASILTDFLREAAANASTILQRVLAHYVDSRDERRRLAQEPDVDAVLPEVASLDELRDLIDLSGINLFADDQGAVIGVEFGGLGKGVGIRWRNGSIEEIGFGKIARPQRPK